MDANYICYCGLYCINCAVKVKVEPAAKNLYQEMKNAGFEEIMPMIPGAKGFWPFLKSMADDGVCISCREGSGNPGCTVRSCAKEKNIEMCALCPDYPCATFDRFFMGYPILKHDNALLREQGIEAWGKMQDERQARGFTYSGEHSEKEAKN